MELKNGQPTFYASSPASWRDWLAENHDKTESIWLILYKKDSGVPSLTYDQAVDEALCFGWIDSKPNKRDDQSFYQFFSKRNPKSNWSQVNKLKIDKLEALGKMMPAGRAMVRLAKEKGTWDALEHVDSLQIPADLKEKLNEFPPAFENFDAFPKSVKRGILEWIFNAKTAETRTKRLLETATLAQKNERANQFVRKK